MTSAAIGEIVAASTTLMQRGIRHAAVGTAPEALADIYQDEVCMAIWQRQSDPSLSEESQTLLTKKGITTRRATVSAENIRCLDKVIPDLEPYPNLTADIQLLAEMFICLFGLKAIGLRLTSLANPMCPRFHVDRVPCRLITTYVGKGSEWLPHHVVDRSKLGSGNGGLSDKESGLYPSEQYIQGILPGDVALLKGELWEGNEGAGLVHRSPAVDHDQRRLLLTFDFM